MQTHCEVSLQYIDGYRAEMVLRKDIMGMIAYHIEPNPTGDVANADCHGLSRLPLMSDGTEFTSGHNRSHHLNRSYSYGYTVFQLRKRVLHCSRPEMVGVSGDM